MTEAECAERSFEKTLVSHQWKMSDFGSPAIQVWSNLSGQWRNINEIIVEGLDQQWKMYH